MADETSEDGERDDKERDTGRDNTDGRGPGGGSSGVVTEGGVTKRYTIENIGRQQESTFINEGNLYRLTIKSKKPEAEPFEAWVCDEVITGFISGETKV